MPQPSPPVPIERFDLHDYLPPSWRPAFRLRARRPLAMDDDWPAKVPVGQAELDALEIHLADFLDRLLGPPEQ
jgi:hypothetical protein